jgi:two-component system, sensor histidine kinase and response regulator
MSKAEILIIEDSRTFAFYLSDVISKDNYKATIALTGKEALDCLSKSSFNLILLDMILPDCTGIDIIKKIRLTHSQTELPVIFISATTDEQKITESLELGGNDFISKPFSEITLKIKIKNLLQLQLSGMQLTENLEIQKEQNKQLQKYTNELSQMNKEKDLFISILAHDLKNPFTSLLGFSDMLRINFNKYTPEQIEKKANIINKILHQTYSLLQDLILWSRAQAGRVPFEPRKLKLCEICNEIISEKIIQAEAKKIKLYSLISESITVMADPNMLKTILRNLISNAIKFTKENGEIKISTTELDNTTTVCVSDNGIGIDSKAMLKLFASANLYSTKGTSNEEGTGLGLLLCKGFVENHGGKIWVESEVGKGSDFKFTMPLCAD